MLGRARVRSIAVALLALAGLAAADEAVASGQAGFALERRKLESFSLADVLLVSTLDGALQARKRTTGDVLWTLESSSLVEAHLPPGEASTTWLAEPSDHGGLYYFTEDGGIQQISASVHDLVEKSPFGMGVENIVYTGSRQTTLYALDVRTGEPLHAYGMANAYDIGGGPVDPRHVVILGRTEYTLEIHERIGAPAYLLKIATWASNTRDQDLEMQYTKPLDSLYVVPIPNNTIMALAVDDRPRWNAQTPSLLVRVFDVLQDRDGRLALVKQPPLEFPGAKRDWELYVDKTPEGSYAVVSGSYYTALLEAAPVAPYCMAPRTSGILGKHTLECQEQRHASETQVPSLMPPPGPPRNWLDPPPDAPPGPMANPTLPPVAGPDQARSTLSLLLENLLAFVVLAAVGVSQGWISVADVGRLVQKALGQAPPPARPEKQDQKRRRRGARGGRRARELKSGAGAGGLGDDADAAIDEALEISDTVLGRGSNGTIVFKGRYQDRDVAVKRLLLDFYDAGSQEIKTLVQTDEHPNIVRYFYKCHSDKFLYIALELCPSTLEHLIEGTAEFAIPFDPLDALRQITLGLEHLHGKQVVHRDIKPQNILVSLKDSVERTKGDSDKKRAPVFSFRYLISDFGLCRKLEVEQSSFLPTVANGSRAGTAGWAAPEITSYTADQDRLTRAVDIFSMGCLFYYVLSGGKHPFGEDHMRKVNIEHRRAPEIELTGAVTPEANDLIVSMVAADPSMRPDITEILNHPMFWSDQSKLDFLVKVSDRLEHENREEHSELIDRLEAHAADVVGSDWHERFPKPFLENLRQFRPYRGERILDLLRALRNKLHHYNDFTPELKKCVGAVPSGYLEFFISRFPRLFVTLYHYAKENFRDEDAFKQFF